MVRTRFLLATLLPAMLACAQQAATPSAKAIDQRLHKLRSLEDEDRAVETKHLALEIRALPNPGNQLGEALTLSNFATEGDFGRDTLHEVAVTLADAIRRTPAAPDAAFDELARLAHYEHVDVTLDDPRFEKAMARLREADDVRQRSDFTLKDLHGKSWELKKLQGKVVLVNFWATWCPPCRKEMPDLNALYHRFKDQGLVILAISDEDESKVRPFISAQKYSYPILLDPGTVVGKRFLIGGIPKSLVYDRAGKLVAQSSDMRTMGQFEEMLKAAGLQPLIH